VGGVQSPRVLSLFIKQVEALGVIVLSKQKLELCIAPGAPDPKLDVGEPHEKVPSHRRSEVIQSDTALSPRCAAPGSRSEDSRPFIGLERRTSGNEILGILNGTHVDV
jgi:hypothetical protein